MASIAGAALLAQARKGALQQYETDIQTVIRALQGLVSRAATLPVQRGNATVYVIPRTSERQLLQEAGNTVQRFFVGSDFRSAYADDGLTPLAPYPALLNHWLAWTAARVVAKHTGFMKKNLPPDVQTWLTQRLDAAELYVIGEQAKPVPTYDPFHLWLDPRGHKLSDRIWNTSLEARKQIDRLLADAVRTGRDGRAVARDLETFLLPGRGLKTTRFYGRSASFDAVRLLRSELARAHGVLTVETSRTNPFVTGVDWHLSARHTHYDVCDPLATIGMGGERLKAPYVTDGFVPVPCQHSHVLCLCFLTGAVGEGVAGVVADLRAMMGRGDEAPVTPIDTFRFLRHLIGTYLASLIWREVVGR